MCDACLARPLSHKDHVRGKVDPDDFDKIVDYTPRNRKRKPNKVKRNKTTRAGCDANNFKSHVYIWTNEYEDERHLFYRYYGYHKWEREVCVGCGKRRASRECARYMKRKERLWNALPTLTYSRYRRYGSFRWFKWEEQDEDYMAFIAAWKNEHPNNALNYSLYSTWSW